MDVTNKDKITDIVSILDQSKNVPTTITDTSDLIRAIAAAPDKTELTKQLELFNLNQTKKNAARVVRLEELLGKVEDQVAERLDKRPDNISNKELIDYMGALSSQIDRSQKRVDMVTGDNIVPISVNGGGSTENHYNINLGTELNKENKDNVVSAIKDIIDLLQNSNQESIPVMDENQFPDLQVIDDDSSEDSNK